VMKQVFRIASFALLFIGSQAVAQDPYEAIIQRQREAGVAPFFGYEFRVPRSAFFRYGYFPGVQYRDPNVDYGFDFGPGPPRGIFKPGGTYQYSTFNDRIYGI
jgi:hypothetical protein